MRRQTTSTAPAVADAVREGHVGVGVIAALRERNQVIHRPRCLGHGCSADVTAPTVSCSHDTETQALSLDGSAFLRISEPLALSRLVGIRSAPSPLRGARPLTRLIGTFSPGLRRRAPYGFASPLRLSDPVRLALCQHPVTVRVVPCELSGIARKTLFLRHRLSTLVVRLAISRPQSLKVIWGHARPSTHLLGVYS